MPRNQTRKMLGVDPDKCTGCRLCEVACSLEHEGFCNTSYARLRIIKEEEKGLDFPHVCQHCTDAPCEAACPTAALFVGKDGVIELDLPKCIGCGLCFVACPVGAIFFEPSGEHIRKCDLCGGDPQCVKVCEPHALTYVDRDQMYLTLGRKMAQQHAGGTRQRAEAFNVSIEGLKT